MKYYYEILFTVVVVDNCSTNIFHVNGFFRNFYYILIIISYNRVLEETIAKIKANNQYNNLFDSHVVIFDMVSTCLSWFVIYKPANFLATLGPYGSTREGHLTQIKRESGLMPALSPNFVKDNNAI